jgi:hypothetical protein
MTSERYIKEVAALAEADPTNVLLPTLQRGYSAVNVYNLKKAWALVQKVNKGVEKEEMAIVRPQSKTTDENLLRLFREKGRLDRQMRATSNTFHACKSDIERADVVDNLQAMQKDLVKLNNDIKYYEIHKKLPTTTTTPTLNHNDYQGELPTDPFEIIAALEVARKSIARYKSDLEKMPPAVMDDKRHPLRKRYEKSEKSLKQWQLRHEALKHQKETLKNG